MYVQYVTNNRGLSLICLFLRTQNIAIKFIAVQQVYFLVSMTETTKTDLGRRNGRILGISQQSNYKKGSWAPGTKDSVAAGNLSLGSVSLLGQMGFTLFHCSLVSHGQETWMPIVPKHYSLRFPPSEKAESRLYLSGPNFKTLETEFPWIRVGQMSTLESNTTGQKGRGSEKMVLLVKYQLLN